MQPLQSLYRLNREEHRRTFLNHLQILFLVFFVCCIAGWIYEEIFYYFTEHFVGNRGFLFGPYLPVYGFGSVLMLLLLKPFKKQPAVFFVLAMLVTGVLEGLTGYVMWEVWGRRWWDYTGLFLNIGGYVCLRSVLTFAVGGLALVYLLDPLLERLILRMKPHRRHILCGVIAAMMSIDLVLSLLLRDPIG